MKIAALVLCFGAGMLQNAMERSTLHMKLWLYVIFQVFPIAATVAELIVGFRAFRWWSLLICYGFFGIPDFVFAKWGRNPLGFFLVGFVASLVALALLLW